MYKTSIHKVSAWRFQDNLKTKFSTVISNIRNKAITDEILKENNQERNPVHNFTQHTFNNEINNILRKGANYIPLQEKTPESTIQEIKRDIYTAVKNYSSYITKLDTTSKGCNRTLNLNLNHPNFNNNSRTYLIDVLDRCQEISANQGINCNTCDAVANQELQLIKTLADKPDIIINTADKNLGLSINTTEWYIKEYFRQVKDDKVYCKIPYEKLNAIIHEGIQNLTILHGKYTGYTELRNYDLNILIQRNIDSVHIPTLNITPKVHKLHQGASPDNESELKGRPIVNGFATLNTEPSQLLGKIFSNCLHECICKAASENIISPIIASSKEVKDRLSRLSFSKYKLDNIYFITFDFSSLYTSIKTWTVFDTIHFLGAFLKLDKPLINLMKDLFNFIKQNAYFTVANTLLFLQKEGFAMRSYDSADGANLVLFKSEYNYYMLQNSKLKAHIIEFFRFIDDGSMIICIDFEDIKHFLTTVASYYPKELEIEFKVSKFNTNFLDLTYGIGAETYCNDKCYYRVYQKPFNAYSYTNYTSNHPKGVFKGIIATECHRYRNFSCNEKEYKHICNLFRKVLKKMQLPCIFHSKAYAILPSRYK